MCPLLLRQVTHRESAVVVESVDWSWLVKSNCRIYDVSYVGNTTWNQWSLSFIRFIMSHLCWLAKPTVKSSANKVKAYGLTTILCS